VCHKGTVRVPAFLLAFAAIAAAQNPPDWRKVGGFSVNLALASPATGRVEQVWFSPGGSTLFARTQSGKVFVTADFVSWSAVADAVDAPAVTPATAVRLPETGAAIVAANDAAAGEPASIFGLGRQVSRSQDGGRTWVNLTGYHGRAVIGPTQHSVAVSPVDPDQLVVANDYGVWRSLDGGSTWAGLNQNLPNLSVEHIVSTPTGVAGTRIQAAGLGELELPPGSAVWQVAMANDVAADAANKDRYSRMLGTKILSVASSKSTLYAGSADGRIFASQDGGNTFGVVLPYKASGPVESIFADPTEPNLAVAAVAGNGPHVLRTRNSGVNWDQLDSPSLPGAPAHGIAADRVSGSVYVATDKGVFYGRADLESMASNPVSWQSLTAQLTSAPATDVRLDPAGVQLYIALDGYGVYAAAAPHSRSTLRT